MKRERLWIALVALGAGLAVLIQFRRGQALCPDSWWYWQGSLSLPAGLGFRDLLGRAIEDWPPLYSCYLAIWNSMLGVSAGTLVLSTAFATSLAVAAWSLPIWCVSARLQTGKAACWYALVYVALLHTLHTWQLRSETLQGIFLPLLLYMALKVETRRVTWPRGLWIGVLLGLAIANRNAGVIFMPPMLFAIGLRSQGSLTWRLSLCTLVAILALTLGLAWSWLQPTWSNEIGWGLGRYSLGQYLGQFIRGIDDQVTASKSILDYPVLVLCGWYLWRRRSPMGRFALLSAIVLILLFQSTFVIDQLKERFTLFFSMIVVAFGMLAASVEARPWLYRVLVLYLLVWSGQGALRRMIEGEGASPPSVREADLREFVPWSAYIELGRSSGPPVQTERGLAVVPPFDWLDEVVRRQRNEGPR